MTGHQVVLDLNLDLDVDEDLDLDVPQDPAADVILPILLGQYVQLDIILA